MKTVLLVVLLAAAATASVVNNDVPDVVVLPDAADVDVNEMPEVFVTDVLEQTDLIDVTDDGKETAVESRRHLVVGTISGKLIYDAQHVAGGVLYQQVVKDLTIFSNGRITAIRVTRIGASTNATPSIQSGGVGSPFVSIRLQSATGLGFHYWVEVYAS